MAFLTHSLQMRARRRAPGSPAPRREPVARCRRRLGPGRRGKCQTRAACPHRAAPPEQFPSPVRAASRAGL